MKKFSNPISSSQRPEPPPPPRSSAHPQKPEKILNAKDIAIEHAEYMAKAAENYLAVMNKALNEDTDLRGCEDSISDAYTSLKSMIYEFRKRAARA